MKNEDLSFTKHEDTAEGMSEDSDFGGAVEEISDAEYAAMKMEVEAARDAAAAKEDAPAEQDAPKNDGACCDGLDAASIERRDMELVLEQNSTGGAGDTLLIHYAHPVAAEMNGYKTEGSAGLDLAVVCPNCDTMRLSKGTVTMVHTGTHVAIPSGHCGLLVCRSSAAEQGVTMLPSVAVIDSDYRGEIMLPLTSTRSSGTSVYNGERFVQMVIVPASVMSLYTVEHKSNLPATTRGENGFGHTGK